ncbi:MAG: hypothetical protein RLZZ24_1322 [Pseudomonadota bacterium]
MPLPYPTGFMVLHSNRLEGLRELMLTFMRNHPLPPLSPEVLLVQSNGMKHWLELSLAEHLGICAATRIELPSTMLWHIYRLVLGTTHAQTVVPERMPLDKAPMVWRLMRVLPGLIDQPAFAPLARYLDTHETDALRLYQLANQLADVLDGYQNYRSDWLDDWAQGHDVLRQAHGSPVALPDAQRWQAPLWRALMNDLAQEIPNASSHFTSRAQVHEAFLQALRTHALDAPIAGLPRRLMVFGVSSMPMQTVQALAALGRVCQVMLWVHNPCQYHWAHVVPERVPLRQSLQRRQPLREGLLAPSAPLTDASQFELHTQSNPLLAAWGKQGRDYLHLLDEFDDVARYRAQFDRIDLFIDPVRQAQDEGQRVRQLAQLQSAVLHLSPAPDEPWPLDENDHSISLNAHYSAQREVEVLHDQILAWLDEDATLQARDIMVMVPDMAQFAAHIHAVFGRFAPGQSRHVPYHVADTLAQEEPLVQALSQLLQLPQQRLTLTQWQSWFDVPAMRRRFGLDESDVQRIHAWLSHAQVRWGLDATHRRAWGMDDAQADADQNTWLFGLQRLLLGYAHGHVVTNGHNNDPSDVWQGVLAAPGIQGLDAPLVDGLLAWLQEVVRAQIWLAQPHTPQEWVRRLQGLVDRFFLAQEDDELRLIEKVLAPLARWQELCDIAHLQTPLPLSVVREHWLGELDTAAMHHRFFGSGVQFATLMPMRTVPFRVICLLGMNDADYPRRQTPRDFDLMNLAQQWRAGDRSRREDDRYLFLEAVLSARERLYISWQGRRTSDHERMPPSVLVAQLQDHLNQAWSRAREVRLHPLQPFSERYFLADTDWRTYDPDWQAARATPPTIASKDTQAPWPASIDHTHLQRLLRQSVDVFLQDRWQVRLDVPPALGSETEPFALDGLDQFIFGQDMAMSPNPDLTAQRLQLSGALPLGGFGALQCQRWLNERQTLQSRWQNWQADDWQVLPTQSLSLSCTDGPELHAQWAVQSHPMWRQSLDGSRWLQVQWRNGAVTQGTGKNRQARLDVLPHLWLHHLLACASGTPTHSVLLGLDASLQLASLPADDARDALRQLVAAWVHAWQTPLLLPRKTACAWLLTRDKQLAAGQDTPLAEQAAHEAAHTVFIHEQSQHGGLQRLASDWETVSATLPLWAPRLYGPMAQRVEVVT